MSYATLHPNGEAWNVARCLCGSAVWLDVTASVCIDSDQILGHRACQVFCVGCRVHVVGSRRPG